MITKSCRTCHTCFFHLKTWKAVACPLSRITSRFATTTSSDRVAWFAHSVTSRHWLTSISLDQLLKGLKTISFQGWIKSSRSVLTIFSAKRRTVKFGFKKSLATSAHVHRSTKPWSQTRKWLAKTTTNTFNLSTPILRRWIRSWVPRRSSIWSTKSTQWASSSPKARQRTRETRGPALSSKTPIEGNSGSFGRTSQTETNSTCWIR